MTANDHTDGGYVPFTEGTRTRYALAAAGLFTTSIPVGWLVEEGFGVHLHPADATRPLWAHYAQTGLAAITTLLVVLLVLLVVLLAIQAAQATTAEGR